jgi:hypothetical protein
MTELLERECEVFSRCLSGEPPGDYVRQQYLAAHRAGAVEAPGGATPFERAVVTLARLGPGMARALDAHARVFANGSLLRRKLVLLLALLEVRSRHAERIDTPTGSSTFALFAALAWLGLRFVVTVFVTALALLPVRLYCVFSDRSAGENGAAE